MVKKTEEEVVDSKDLMVVQEKTAIAAFNDDVALEKLYADIKATVEKMLPAGADMSKKKDRDTIRSIAAKIPKVKTKVDEFRKRLTEDMRLKITAIDGRGKTIRDRLDELKDEVRKPLTDWENAEEERINKIKDTIEEIRTLGQISFGESSADIQARIDKLPTHDLDWYAEFKDEAEIVINDAYNNMVSSKTKALNAEKEAAEREAERQELERLRLANEKAEREKAAREEISTIKTAGNGMLYLDNDFLSTEKTVEWLIRLRIDSRFGELVDEANDARDEALKKMQRKLEIEKDEAANEKARQDEIQRQQDEIAAQRRELELQEEQRQNDERERTAAAAREANEAESAAERQRIADDEAAAEAERRRQMREALQENRAQAIEDLTAALVSTNRASAPIKILDAIIAGQIRHVSAPDLAADSGASLDMEEANV